MLSSCDVGTEVCGPVVVDENVLFTSVEVSCGPEVAEESVLVSPIEEGVVNGEPAVVEESILVSSLEVACLRWRSLTN